MDYYVAADPSGYSNHGTRTVISGALSLLTPLRLLVLAFSALVVALLITAMPSETVQQKRQRILSFLIVGAIYTALVLVYVRISN